MKNILASLKESLKIMMRNKVGFVGFIGTLFFILLAFIGPYLMPLNMKTDLNSIYTGPTLAHPLGTDYQGRDILMQVLHGGREVIYVALMAALLTVLIAATFGALAAVVGGIVDTLLNGLAEIIITIPHFPLLLVLASLIKFKSATGLAVILAAIGWGGLMRAIRAQVLSLKERDYVEAARVLGLPTSHIIFKEILPNMLSYISVQFILSITGAIYAQVGLIFLGVVPMEQHNWGVMITLAWNQGALFNPKAQWYLLVPITIIVLLQLSLITMTRSMEELFNPRLRRGG